MPFRSFIYKVAEDGQDLLADVHFTESSHNNENKAIVLVFHAGGYTLGSRTLVPAATLRSLCARGFVVVSVDYRLCPHVSIWEGPMADARDALQWARNALPGLLKKDAGVDIDGEKVMVFGQSSGATLALLLGGLPNPPRAIAALYGAAYFADSVWSTPSPGAAMMPVVDRDFADKVYSEPPTSHAEFQTTQYLAPGQMPVPDLSKPRDAWMVLGFKEGNHLAKCVKDGNFERVDPATYFREEFPPTIFATGTADHFIDPDCSRRMYEELRRLRVSTKLVTVEGGDHGFDFGIDEEDANFQSGVVPVLEFLEEYVNS
ncbi:uncharacterized protein A1O5_05615 [Cladophialophora psammophila CBS 110553]|uniref:Alpha/beta hydrolase fold-3 domain-containing protein n=1 Tax=Cladophialophora psammophila CBS 110553 TaxID=1182543 RepID=W9X3B9_9EURO|nr:uncharacterized protein A1O5_05615 [Cladophialophora psammophila CBS 110553]EXJ71805.1 hypothetical protein A1O5_05615 [Cladophialophora psammophila CBS 110553]